MTRYGCTYNRVIVATDDNLTAANGRNKYERGSAKLRVFASGYLRKSEIFIVTLNFYGSNAVLYIGFSGHVLRGCPSADEVGY